MAEVFQRPQANGGFRDKADLETKYSAGAVNSGVDESSAGILSNGVDTPEHTDKLSNGGEAATTRASVASSVDAAPNGDVMGMSHTREGAPRRHDVNNGTLTSSESAALDGDALGASLIVDSSVVEPTNDVIQKDIGEKSTNAENVLENKENEQTNGDSGGEIMATDAKEPGPKNDERPSDVTLEQRAKDAAKKAAEYGGYLQLMEERVASLELKLQPPQEEAAAKKAGSSSKSSSKRVPAIPELHLVKWAEFKNKLKDDDKIYAIEALVGEVKYWYQKETQIHPNLLEENGIRKDSSNQKELVKRIRINSLPILTILSDVTDYEWVLEPIVLIYPFKLLVERDGAIREQMKRLEIKWGSTDNEAAGVGAGTSLHNSPNPGATTVARGEESSQITPNGIGSKTMDARKENTAKIKDDNEPNSTQNESRKKEKEDLMDSLETLRDMRCLIKFMDEQIAPVVARINDRSCTRISFHDLWHLFRPGDYIFVPRHSPRDRPSDPSDQPAGESPQTTHKRNDRYQEDWRILGCGGGRPNLISASDEDSVVPKHKVNPFEVSTYYVDFNGKVFGATTRWFQIKPFDGEREITSLEFYPSRFVRNAEARRAELKTRGEKFRGYRTFQHQQYKGMTFACQPCGTEFSEDKTNPEPIDSQVVVDFAEAIRDDYDWHPEGREFDTSCAFSREVDDDVWTYIWKKDDEHECFTSFTDNIYNDASEDRERTHAFESNHPLLREDPDQAFVNGWGLTEEELVLLPARVLAFVFRNRKFAALNVDYLQPVSEYTGGWEDLKLVAGHKEMLKALVRTHLRDKQTMLKGDEDEKHSHDIVRGKGQGLVVLLHGVPGVGKTSTAECVAESHGKPLFPITCGDLGVTAESVSTALEEKFHLAQVWDCVLLLDEADVFLAERANGDIQRNALVSVFLRTLEYYTGILFLTTNRVGSFDEAFKSRIHLALYFPALKEKQTLAIWKMNLKRTLARKNNMMKADREEILAFAKKQYTDGKKTDSNWNGRQIRNAFQTAAALAEYDAQVKYQDPNGPVYSRLHSDHFNTVLQASRQFDDYIKSVRGETAEDRAHLQRLRDDLFKSTAIDYRGPETHSKSKSAKGQKLRQPQDEYDDEAEFEEEEAPPQVLAPAPTSKRLLRSREPPQDTYSPREVSQSQAPGTQRLRQPPARPTQLQTNAAPRSKRSSNHGYPTPSTSNSALHEQMEPGDTYYAPRGAAIEAKRRPPANQRLVGRNAAVNVRQPEPEVESEEPDYSDDDDEDDNME